VILFLGSLKRKNKRANFYYIIFSHLKFLIIFALLLKINFIKMEETSEEKVAVKGIILITVCEILGLLFFYAINA
jgi:hypothetical protein